MGRAPRRWLELKVCALRKVKVARRAPNRDDEILPAWSGERNLPG